MRPHEYYWTAKNFDVEGLLLRERVLRWVGMAVYRHYKIVIATTIILLGLSIFSALGLKISTRYVDLLPQDHPAVKNYFRVLSKFGGTDYLFVIVRGKDTKQVKSMIDEIARRLEIETKMEYVQSRADIKSFSRYGLLYLDLKTLKKIDTLLYERKFEELTTLAASFIAMKEEISRMASGGFSVTEDGYFMDEKGESAFLIAKPPFSADELDKTIPFAKKIKKIALEVKKSNPGSDVMLAGNYMFQYEQRQVINTDILIVAVVALVIIILLLAIAFRSLSTPFLSMGALGCGILFTLGIARVLVGQLNTLSSIFAAVLMGIGIEYGIAIISRYGEEREKGLTGDEAFSNALSMTGKAVLTGALTTAVAFFAISFSDFRAMRDLGLVLGIGVICSLLANVFILPALVAFKERLRPYRKYRGVGESRITRRLGVSVRNHSLIYLIGGLIITVGLGVSAGFIKFESNLRKIEPRGLDVYTAEDILAKNFGIGPEFVIVISNNEAAMRDVAAKAQKLKTVRGVESLATLIPPDQEEKLFIMARIKKRIEEIDPSWLGYVPGEMLEILREIGSDTLTESKIPPDVLRKYKAPDGIYATYVYPKKNMYEEKNVKEFLRELSRISPEATGFPAIIQDILESTRKGLNETTILSAIAVVLMVIIDFQKILPTLLAFMPLALSLLWMVGAINLIGMKFNIINIAVTPIILGIGIDYGVYVLHRYAEEHALPGETVPDVLASTGRAILVSGLTVLAAFAALTLARYRGLANLGVASVIGISFALISALTLLPSLLNILEKKRKKGRAF